MSDEIFMCGTCHANPAAKGSHICRACEQERMQPEVIEAGMKAYWSEQSRNQAALQQMEEILPWMRENFRLVALKLGICSSLYGEETVKFN